VPPDRSWPAKQLWRDTGCCCSKAGLEVSPDNNDVWDPTRWNEVLKDPAFEIGFESTKQANLDNRILQLLQSKGLGGCQIHNAMVYVRGGRSTYDHWANELGCVGWSYQELVPLFQQVESTVGISFAAGQRVR